MNNKYDIQEKAQFIRLTILLHDLRCYDEALQDEISDKKSLIRKYRHTRNVFVALHNLKEALNEFQLNSDPEFKARTRALRKQLRFVSHIRHKGVGHLDKRLLERAAQWMPQIFNESSKDDEDFVFFECYRAVLEACINSHLNSDSKQKVFNTEIDLLYPENAKIFFEHLSFLVNESISWLSEARENVKSKIRFHTNDEVKEFGIIAGQTEFDLKSESSLEFNEEETRERLTFVVEKIQEIGAEEKVIKFLKKELLGEYNE